jgi:hypothetical protein
MVEINDADPASLAAALATPPEFANATASRDEIAGLGVSRYEIDELEPFVLGPKRTGLTSRPRNG